jgi:hypothetical protein
MDQEFCEICDEYDSECGCVGCEGCGRMFCLRCASVEDPDLCCECGD